ncbi:MAG: hypothetical protein M1827_000792 [Pycnora praestabilis]|nr:MAG: hypothetical protein M1827_000792 [Pycnora praestabilis]
MSSDSARLSSSQGNSRYTLRHLVISLPASPALPGPSSQNGRSAFPPRGRTSLRVVLGMLGVSIVLLFMKSKLQIAALPAPFRYSSHGQETPDFSNFDLLPNHPLPIEIRDDRGRVKWTVSIPTILPFPLQPAQYAEICTKSAEVSMHVAELKYHTVSQHGHQRHSGYYHVDQNFLDVGKAEEHGMLPSLEGTSNQRYRSAVDEDGADDMSEDLHEQNNGEVCEKSLTYVLETSNAGMGLTLMGLWMSYGLAKKEGRAFFIDDTNWPYGRYATYFVSPPKPSCAAPPRVQILPCPHHTRHLLVSAATTVWTFGHAFNEVFEDPRKMGVLRQQPIFALAREGFEVLFHLAEEDNLYFEQRMKELKATRREKNARLVGIHVRHGDRHPFEFQYQKSYIPLDRYISFAQAIVGEQTNTTSSPSGQEPAPSGSLSNILVASDDPDVYAASEMAQAIRAQERIMLASKSTLDAATGQKKKQYLDENIGWEGGFFKDVFWGLGQPSSSLSATMKRFVVTEDSRIHPSPEALRLREFTGRAYLLDLAILGRADQIVCGVSSIGCRLLAVMMGWEGAIVQGGWHNVDGDFDWKGIIW